MTSKRILLWQTVALPTMVRLLSILTPVALRVPPTRTVTFAATWVPAMSVQVAPAGTTTKPPDPP